MTTKPPRDTLLRIGEIADRTGLSPRALRLYEQRGLLSPDSHLASGYRLYGQAAMRRLTQITVLRQAGFGLAQIALLLADEPQGRAQLVREHLDRVSAQLLAQVSALAALRRALVDIDTSPSLSLDDLVEKLTMSRSIDLKLSPKDRDAILDQARSQSPAAMAGGAEAWPVLIGEVRAAMASGLATDSAKARALATRWQSLVEAATGGDPALGGRIRDAYLAQPDAMQQAGLDPAMFAWIGQAMRASG